jgi:hypothetical protein
MKSTFSSSSNLPDILVVTKLVFWILPFKSDNLSYLSLKADYI